MDFRHLTQDDVEILRTYLTPDQKKMLEDVEKMPGFDHTFVEQSNAHLNRIVRSFSGFVLQFNPLCVLLYG